MYSKPSDPESAVVCEMMCFNDAFKLAGRGRVGWCSSMLYGGICSLDYMPPADRNQALRSCRQC